MKFLFLTGAFLLSFSCLHARSFYVDSSIGDDSNSGTSASQAWKTLQKVNNSAFLPGDSILFACGSVLHGQLKITAHGDEKHSVVFDSYGKGAKPTIAADGKFDEAVLLYNSSYVNIENLDITNTGMTRKANRKGVFLLLDN